MYSKDTSIKAEDDLNESDKWPTRLKCKVLKAIKNMRRKKATGDNKILANLLKENGDTEFKVMTVLVNKLYLS